MAKHPVQITPEMQETGALAMALWLARRDRRAHPEGAFDNAGRFYPSDDENADGYTVDVRSPSRLWPNSYNVAARSRAHCLELTLCNRPFVERLVAKGRLLDQVDAHHRRLGAGWILRAARADHEVEQWRIKRRKAEAKSAAEKSAKEAAEKAAEEARPDEDDIAALLAA